MRKALVVAALFACGAATWAEAPAKGVMVVAHEADRRVDVTIDGEPFTSYIWPTSLKKPVLYPLIADDGVTVTRGYPLQPQPGERVDHPHHAGMWFNYGNVNGFDFWNNSDAIPVERRPKMGSIEEGKIVATKSGRDRGELTVTSTWVTGAGDKLLEQTTTYVFMKRKGARVIDEVVTLRALDKAVFNDDKEGLLGMRVARWLESPEEKGGVFTDASGHETKVAAGDSSTVNGVYLTSAGVKGGAAWGTTGRWCLLSGHTGEHAVTIAMIDHPGNPGYATYWHARGYGLFAANPLGRSIFDAKQPKFNFTIEKGKTATFRYRVVIYSHTADAAEVNHEADAFAGESE
ncbi:MAG: PmoA family protein [Acidobacteriota bacterium]